ncbi:MAG: hypothetical protein JSW28_06790 [Thermoplasmata archaeon]|nr:MAG: hypothetical protein JSW28_06790 [Thermoplasmata archaeon]
MSKRIRLVTISLIMVLITIANFGSLAQHPGGGEEEEVKTETLTFSGDTNEGTSWEKTVDLGDINLMSIEFTLTWEDDEGSDSDPDTFSLTTDDGGHEPKGDQGSSGSISVTWEERGLNNTWNMVVTCEDAGDTPLGPVGLIVEVD